MTRLGASIRSRPGIAGAGGRARVIALAAVVAMTSAACFGALSDRRKYFVLHPKVVDAPPSGAAVVAGACRVTTLDSDAAYGKFQVVIRKSPYEIRYSEQNVWAARPAEMVSDSLSEGLQAARVFNEVRRQLGDTAPTYTLSGNLIALELYDSGDLWFAHLAVRLYLSRFSDGQRVWSYDFDQRREIGAGDFGHGARALSELAQEVYTEAARQLAKKFGRELPAGALPPEVTGPAPAPAPPAAQPVQLVEPRAGAGAAGSDPAAPAPASP